MLGRFSGSEDTRYTLAGTREEEQRKEDRGRQEKREAEEDERGERRKPASRSPFRKKRRGVGEDDLVHSLSRFQMCSPSPNILSDSSKTSSHERLLSLLSSHPTCILSSLYVCFFISFFFFIFCFNSKKRTWRTSQSRRFEGARIHGRDRERVKRPGKMGIVVWHPFFRKKGNFVLAAQPSAGVPR